jgi:3-oxoacyl-[acyl-carrier-protein] synthase II
MTEARRKRVIITGLGCVGPHGDVDALWDGLRGGHSAIRKLSVFDPAGFHSQVAGEARAFDPSAHMAQRIINASSRCVQLAVAAAGMAIGNASLDLGRTNTRRIGIYLGTSIGPLGYAMQQYGTFVEKGIERVHPMAPAQNYPGVIASEVAIQFGIRGPAMTISTACTSGADAIGLALSQLRAGVVDVAIAGASEAPLFPALYASFDRLGLMSRWQGDPAEACRPFSRSRDGLVLSEGAAVCILETAASAEARPATMLAELAGFAATSDAYHHFHQLPSGEEAARAIQEALDDAGVDPADVDYVSAHGTGTAANDAVETQVIKMTFGARAPLLPVSSIKSMMGHTMGASGAFAVIACVKALNDGLLPPTINLHDRDPACDLDYVPNVARPAAVRTVVSNTFGFGSRNAVLVIKAFDA